MTQEEFNTRYSQNIALEMKQVVGKAMIDLYIENKKFIKKFLSENPNALQEYLKIYTNRK